MSEENRSETEPRRQKNTQKIHRNSYSIAFKMTSVSSSASSAKVGDVPQSLVCAPCYICLENGPDEDGRPLIRKCSCRGESSAGYHVSCIVNYAKAKTKEAVQDYEADGDDWYGFYDHWTKCANCKQEYEESLCLELAKEMVAHIGTLVPIPETHYLHFEARAKMVSFLPSKEAQEEFKVLLSLLEEQKRDIMPRWHELQLIGERDQKIFLTKEKDSLLMSLGIAQLKEKTTEQTIETWGQRLVANKTLKALVSNHPNKKDGKVVVDDYEYNEDDIDSEIKRIEKQIWHLKDFKGSASDREEEWRREITKLAGINDHQSANAYKVVLAFTLLKQEPPQFQEAISLLQEASEVLERILGSSHKIVVGAKSGLADAKGKYEEFESSKGGRKDDQAGSKRKRDDE